MFTTYCESHASDVSFQVIARILRATLGIDDLAADDARVRVREQIPQADVKTCCSSTTCWASVTRRWLYPTSPPSPAQAIDAHSINWRLPGPMRAGGLRGRGRALDRRGE